MKINWAKGKIKFLEMYSLHSCWFHKKNVYNIVKKGFQFNDHKNLMWGHHQVKMNNIFHTLIYVSVNILIIIL